MALTLYHNDMSVCAQKVRLCLAEKQLAYEDKHLNLRAGGQKRPEYLALNPNGYVPTLVHDHFVLGEFTVICEYIDDAFPAPPLKPDDPKERARMRGFTKFIDAAIFPATATVSMSVAFHHQFTPEMYDTMEKARPGWLANFRQLQKGTDNPAFPAAIRRLDKMIADMERALADHQGPWLVGETYTLADVAYAPYVTRLDHLKFFEGMVEKRSRVAAWYNRMRTRPSYKEALAKWFNPKYLPLMDEKGSDADNLSSSPVTPNLFSFSDGVQTVTQGTTSGSTFSVSTNALGDISGWAIVLFSNTCATPSGCVIETNTNSPNAQDVGEISFSGGFIAAGSVTNNPGTWTTPVTPTPLPATLPLFAGGLGVIGLFGWRKKRKTVPA